MTDYFALLDQPQAPDLDPEKLKQAFHAKTLQAHPDLQHAAGGARETAFAELNEAYQVLRDPKRRLQHLLALRGETPAGQSAAIPADLAELFPQIAGLTRQADALGEKLARTTSALSISLVRPELQQAQEAIKEMLDRLQRLRLAAGDDLRRLSAAERSGKSDNEALQQLYLRFSYLTRWIEQLEEKQVQFSS